MGGAVGRVLLPDGDVEEVGTKGVRDEGDGVGTVSVPLHLSRRNWLPLRRRYQLPPQGKAVTTGQPLTARASDFHSHLVLCVSQRGAVRARGPGAVGR